MSSFRDSDMAMLCKGRFMVFDVEEAAIGD